MGSGARSRRLRWRICGSRHRRADALGARLRHRRLDQAAVRAVRERRPPAHLRHRLPLRHRRLRLQSRPGRAGGEERARLRAAVLDHRRPRPAGRDDGGAPRGGCASAGRPARRPQDRHPEAARRARRGRSRRSLRVRRDDRARPRARCGGGGVRPAALVRVRDGLLLPRRSGRGVVEPRPLRRGPLRAAHRPARPTGEMVERTRDDGFGPEPKRRIMLGHVRALGRLLRRLLRTGAEGANAAHPRAS